MITQLKNTLILTLALAVLAGCTVLGLSTATQSPDLAQSLPTDPTLIQGQLDNGLRYFIKNNLKPENRAELRLAVNAGSILETEGQLGLAHFLEHMAFNGTQNFPKMDLVNYLESIGMRFGPDLNAYTSFDETVYMLQVPTDSISQLEKAFQILEDWSHLMSLEGEEIDKERGVVIEEWRLGRGAGRRMLDQELPIILKGSRYAERLPIGKKEIIETASYETICKFYHDWYRPDNMAVIAVGDFDPDQIQGYIEKHFGRLVKPSTPLDRPVYDVPEHDETLYAIASDPEATRSQVSIMFKHPAQVDKTENDYRQQMVRNLYNNMLNARFAELAQEADAPFLYGYSGSWSWTRTGQIYTLGAAVQEGGIERGLEALLIEAARVKEHGFTSSELERQKKETLRGMERLYLEREKQESRRYASELVRHFLESEAVPGIPFEYELHKKYVPGIGLEEVNALAKELITEKNRVINLESPEKADLVIPGESDLQDVFAHVATLEIEPYAEELSDAPLVADLPPAGAVLDTTYHEDIDVTQWILSNGVRVVMKPTDFKNDEIMFKAYSPGGTSLIGTEDLISARNAARIVDYSGLGEFDLIALEKKLTGQVVSVSPYISSLYEGFNGGASPQDLETLFKLITLFFTGVRVDEDAFATYVNRMESNLLNKSASPESAYSDSVSVTLSSYHPRRKPMQIDDLEKLDHKQALTLYADRFADAGDFTFIFVGSIDLEVMHALATQYLATLPSSGRLESWVDEGVAFPEGMVNKGVYKGLEPKSYTRIAFNGEFEWNRQHRYDAYSMNSVLRIRLREVLREDMGGVYGVGNWISLDRYPKGEYTSQVTFGCSPDRVQELTEAVLTEIRALQTAPVSAEYLIKVKETQRRERELGLKENRYWMSALDSYYRQNRDLSKFMEFDELVNNLSAEAIQQAAIRHFDLDNMVQVTLYPEEMAAE